MESSLRNILFLDIETVSGEKDFYQLDERLQKAWARKASLLDPQCDDVAKAYFEKAAIYAEFGKIIVIGIGYFHNNPQGELCFRTKSLANDKEDSLLQSFLDLLYSFQSKEITLCAHNGKEFDFPYLCRRLLVNGLPLPSCLKMAGRKPWQVRHYDTLDMWKFGDRKHFCSLELLAAIFGIPSSKTTIDGSQVNTFYYKGHHLELIADYCRQDVVVLAQLFLRLNALTLPKQENIILVD